jgi:hypothetical protein
VKESVRLARLEVLEAAMHFGLQVVLGLPPRGEMAKALADAATHYAAATLTPEPGGKTL